MASTAIRLILAMLFLAMPFATALQAQVLDIGTDATYAGPYPGGIENTATGTVTIFGLNAVNGASVFSGTGQPGENAVIIDGTGASVGSEISGLFFDSVANTVELSVGAGMTSQGLFVNTTETALTGGTTNATALVLGDTGATLFNDATGAPVQLHGIADGSEPFDAVNVRQLDRAVTNLSSGIAAVAALAAIPGPVDCKNYSVGLGYGHFNGENAGAVGFRANMPKSNVSLGVGAGFAENSSPAYDAGISFSF